MYRDEEYVRCVWSRNRLEMETGLSTLRMRVMKDLLILLRHMELL